MIVIPIAGTSMRFKKIGVLQPKWSIRIGEQSVLEWATRSILDSLLQDEILLYIVRESDLDTLTKIIHEIGDHRIQFVQIEHSTSGQAETVFEGLKLAKYGAGERLVVWCGDSAYKKGAFNFLELSGNWLAVSKLIGDHWSFIEAREEHVVRTSEKIRISEYASIGLYGFSSIEEFIKTDPARKDSIYGESFIAPLYNRLIHEKKEVKSRELESSNYFPMGTPEEIKQTCLKLGYEIPGELKGS